MLFNTQPATLRYSLSKESASQHETWEVSMYLHHVRCEMNGMEYLILRTSSQLGNSTAPALATYSTVPRTNLGNNLVWRNVIQVKSWYYCTTVPRHGFVNSLLPRIVSKIMSWPQAPKYYLLTSTTPYTEYTSTGQDRLGVARRSWLGRCRGTVHTVRECLWGIRVPNLGNYCTVVHVYPQA